jgi:hypothetical protein
MRSRTSKQRVVFVGRQLRAVDLRIGGYSYREIGKEIGESHEAARKQVKDALQKIETATAESAQELVRIEVERCDAMLKGLWGDAKDGDVDAVIASLRIGKRRSELLGLDAPQSINLGAPGGGPLRIAGLVIAPDDLPKLAEKDLDALETLARRLAVDRNSDPQPDPSRKG